ncbi:TPA: hypothetical protein ACH3X1_003414 [Trebouxia sp. C0004]
MTAASSGAASNSGNSSAYDDNKIENRACELERRREKALKDTKGTARWWKFFQVVTSRSDDKEVLAQLQHKKRKTSGQPSVAEVFLSKEKQVLLTMALYDFFLENSDCVAMHACEHPSLQRFCSLAGIKPLNRKRLAGPVLDKKYSETVGSVDQVLNVNGVHALAVSTI